MQNSPSFIKNIFFFSILTLLIAAIIASYCLRSLWWDGSHIYINMLLKNWFYNTNTRFSLLIVEAPMIMALKLGFSSQYFLIVLWGLGLYVTPLIFLVSSWLFLKDNEKHISLFAVLSFVIANHCSIFPAPEVCVAHALFWLLFSISYSSDTYKSLSKLIFFNLFTILAVKIYPSFIFFSIILLIVTFMRTKNYKLLSKHYLLVWLVRLFLFINITHHSYELLPLSTSSDCYDHFVYYSTHFFKIPILMRILLTLISCVTLSIIISNLLKSTKSIIVSYIFLTLFLIIDLVLRVITITNFIGEQWAGRTTNLTVPLAISFCALIVLFLPKFEIFLKRLLLHISLAVIVIAFSNLIWQIGGSLKSLSFFKKLANVAKQEKGVTTFAEAGINIAGLPVCHWSLKSLFLSVSTAFEIKPIKTFIVCGKKEDYFSCNQTSRYFNFSPSLFYRHAPNLTNHGIIYKHLEQTKSTLVCREEHDSFSRLPTKFSLMWFY